MGQVEDMIYRVREQAKASGLSQRELAARAGVTEGHISRILSGKRLPSARLLFRLMAVFTEGGDSE